MFKADSTRWQGSPAKSRTHQQGFTLIEVLTAMLVLVIGISGTVAALAQARFMAEEAVYETSAHIAALSYMEQLKTTNYTNLATAFTTAATQQSLPVFRGDGTAEVLFPTPLSAAQSWSPYGANWPNWRRVDVFGRYGNTTPPTGATDFMLISFTVTVTNLSAGSNDSRCRIDMDYRWQSPNYFLGRPTRSAKLTLVRSDLPSYVN